jgi:hypothetical protein
MKAKLNIIVKRLKSLLAVIFMFSVQYWKVKYFKTFAGIAQLVEQWIEDPRVTSSNLVPGIFLS